MAADKKDRDGDFEKQMRKLGREIRSTPKISKAKPGKAGKQPPPPKKGGK